MAKKKQHKLAKKLRRNLKKKTNRTHVETILESYFGYDKYDQVQCMITRVEEIHLAEFEINGYNQFTLGDWFLSFGTCHQLEIVGPFYSPEKALIFGKENLDIVRFDYQPRIDSNYHDFDHFT